MNGQYRALWLNKADDLEVIDQRYLPFAKNICVLKTAHDICEAIKDMTVRGAGVIGNVAAFGVFLAAREFEGDKTQIKQAAIKIRESRPTAVNLMWAVDRMLHVVEHADDVIAACKAEAIAIADKDVLRTQKIGQIGCDIIEDIMVDKKINQFNILTHCNAGWLAIVDSGSALAPIYEAQKRGINIHVWVDETRPRNQGASLTSWELLDAGIQHTIIPDNTGGHLVQQGLVDMVITGADRVALNGDAANKIGTYLKALAAKDNDVPFYIALPINTFDFDCKNGVQDIEIEQRSEDEVHMMRGLDNKGNVQTIRITPEHSKTANYGFDVTPARLITGLITEAGVIAPNQEAIRQLQPSCST
ncbi:S-methyl-5-thioribose-1-phosphate isomerase [Ghiorsea bivora]|uniref:S-methyl-5-thioribose-1-phosphate isomerase n=1 Tax=Ghiorsea bivora TaxID=1485545 RepID=UPI000570F5B4|nr:S-methyl-5-thioribose-1-phosphate isomerase [Ghiorsea bivora]